MKIIKEGHFENKMNVRCYGCEAELEISSEDLKKFSNGGDYFFLCPCCGVGHWIEKNKTTIGVSKALK